MWISRSKVHFLCLFIVFYFNILNTSVKCARILGVFQFPSYSHQVIYQRIWTELALRGHDVVVITPNPTNDKNLTNLREVDVSYIKNLLTPEDELQESMSKNSPTPDIMKAFYKISLKLQEAILKDENFAKIYNNPKEKFDILLVECLHPGMYALAGKFGIPSVGISSLGVTVATHGSIGNTNHPVLYPDMNLPTHSNLTIWEKIYSTYFSWFLYIYYNHQVIPEADSLARKYLGQNLPYLGDLAENVSFLLINTNHIIHNIRPNVPKIIQMGQIHIKPPKKLPKDLQKILDGAPQGAIYFSLGSNVQSVNLGEEKLKIILQAMEELPFLFIWKWESDDFKGKPSNVVTRKWFPQQDILSHPNIKVFVTQGGLQSIEEAISREVPMVGIPFLGDQPMNVNKMVLAGLGLGLEINTLNKEELKDAIKEVALNKKYKKNIHKIRLELEDQPETGLDRAIWWIEYAIRHKGAPLLISATAKIWWYQYFFIDLILFAILTLWIAIKIFKILLKIMSYVPNDDEKED